MSTTRLAQPSCTASASDVPDNRWNLISMPVSDNRCKSDIFGYVMIMHSMPDLISLPMK